MYCFVYLHFAPQKLQSYFSDFNGIWYENGLSSFCFVVVVLTEEVVTGLRVDLRVDSVLGKVGSGVFGTVVGLFVGSFVGSGLVV